MSDARLSLPARRPVPRPYGAVCRVGMTTAQTNSTVHPAQTPSTHTHRQINEHVKGIAEKERNATTYVSVQDTKSHTCGLCRQRSANERQHDFKSDHLPCVHHRKCSAHHRTELLSHVQGCKSNKRQSRACHQNHTLSRTRGPERTRGASLIGQAPPLVRQIGAE